jgi:transcriptional regulator with GAF, ATPase, and Fis domain
VQDKMGFAEAASGGTLFLDETGEIPLAAQAKLLRLLQNREVQRVGAPRSRQIDVRFVAATNRDLRALAHEGKLREDLYYRLATVEIKLPRLADRKEDLPLLLRHFVELFSERYRKPSLYLSRGESYRRCQSDISSPGFLRFFSEIRPIEFDNSIEPHRVLSTCDSAVEARGFFCNEESGSSGTDKDLRRRKNLAICGRLLCDFLSHFRVTPLTKVRSMIPLSFPLAISQPYSHY